MNLNEFEILLEKLNHFASAHEIPEFDVKISVNKWSKKEILGHLIDSAINNIQRFTEIQFSESLYIVRDYNQNELVKVNDYQNIDNQDLFDLCISLNKQILQLIKKLNKESLKHQLIFSNGKKADLEFLINDYIKHFQHHLKQIN